MRRTELETAVAQERGQEARSGEARFSRIGYYVNEHGDLVPHDPQAQAEFSRLIRGLPGDPALK